jgi:1-acyl-sn-glycerol-3-phosphate acyltransferase
MGIIRLVLLIVWSILCISLALILMVLTFSRKLPLVMARGLWSPGILFFLSSKTEVTGLENIEKGKNYVLVSNHLSYLDIPSLFKTIPLNIHFVAKKELKKVPFLGWFMTATGMIYIDRKNRNKASQSLKDAAALIANGKTVLIFPEGTVSSNGEIQKFKKGGFHLALEAGVDILPISLKGTNSIWSDESNIKFKPGKVKVNIGKPISLDDYTYNQLNELTTNVKSKIEALQKLN